MNMQSVTLTRLPHFGTRKRSLSIYKPLRRSIRNKKGVRESIKVLTRRRLAFKIKGRISPGVEPIVDLGVEITKIALFSENN